MFILNNTEFKTKTPALAYAKKYINEQIPFFVTLTLDTDHGLFLMQLLSYHPCVEWKSGTGIKAFIKRKTVMGGYTLYIIRTDNTEESFSYMACLGKKFDDLATAMRSAISPYTVNFKRTSELKCCLCDITEESSNFHVDHKSISFSEIKKQFLEKNILDVPTSFVKDSLLITSFSKSDYQFASSWISFHNNLADYQMLCSTCNVLKSNK